MSDNFRKHLDKIGCDWDQRQRVFRLADDGDGPTVTLTPQELVELGVEAVLAGTRAMVEKRWQ